VTGGRSTGPRHWPHSVARREIPDEPLAQAPQFGHVAFDCADVVDVLRVVLPGATQVLVLTHQSVVLGVESLAFGLYIAHGEPYDQRPFQRELPPMGVVGPVFLFQSPHNPTTARVRRHPGNGWVRCVYGHSYTVAAFGARTPAGRMTGP
jgi:hypothetical protein